MVKRSPVRRGNDTLWGDHGNDLLKGDWQNDLLYGGEGRDSLFGGSHNDTLYGQNGNDRFYGDAGNDSIIGGGGYDTASGGDGDDVIKGDWGNDLLYGQNGSDRLFGGSQNDTLYGQNGNDLMFGDSGNDSLLGGGGDDIFVFDYYTAFNAEQMGIDRIFDFGDGNDVIELDKTAFTALRSTAGNGFSRPGEFAVVNDDSLVATSTAYILYSSSTGNLFYNQNGSAAGLGNGGQFATLRDAPSLDAASFAIAD